MPLKSTIAASAAAVAMALAPAVSAAPTISARGNGCTSLGKGPLGYNTTNIGLYSKTPPAVYFKVDHEHNSQLMVSDTPMYENQTLFEFFQCLYTPDQYPGQEGSVQTYQGHIRAPNGQCVSVEHIKSTNSVVKLEDCVTSGDNAHGHVKAAQHFQFQLETFNTFYALNFLGKKAGPVNHEGFGAAGHYHFSLQTETIYGRQHQYLHSSFQPNNPQTGRPAEMLIAQIGDAYQPTTKQIPACKLVRSGKMELVNTKTGAVQAVTADYPPSFPYAISPLINGGGNPTFSFHQCDSDYMGYKSSDGDYYGHFASNQFSSPALFSRQTGGNLDNYILEGPQNANSYNPLNDDKSQVPIFFRLKKDARGYEVHYLGSTAGENKGEYGWMPNSGSGAQAVLVNPSMTDYQLLFTPN